MLVYLWYTLITPVSVGMPVITIIYIVQTCSYLPNTKITWPSPNTRQFCWTICETLIPPAILVIRWKRNCCKKFTCTVICPAYVSMSVKTKLAVVQSHLYLLNINTCTLQHLLYDTSMPPCLQSKCDMYSWFYAVLASSYFLNNQIISAGLDTVT